MKRYFAGVGMVLGMALLAACGNNNTATAVGMLYGTPAVVASKAAVPATRLGGSLQGAALALSGTVSKLAGTAGTAGRADSPGATFSQPNGITTDGTSFFITDYNNHTIRQMDLAGTVSTFVGVPGTPGAVDSAQGTPTFNRPNAITTDGTNLYVTDASCTVRKIVIATKVVSTLAGLAANPGVADGTGWTGSVAGSARFGKLNGITTDGSNLYVSDSNNTIRWIDLGTLNVKTLAGYPGAAGTADGILGASRFNAPSRITCDGPSLYVCDFFNNTIRKIDILTGTVSTMAGKAGTPGSADGIGALATFREPNGITTDGTYLYVSDQYTNIIRRIEISSGTVFTIAGVAGQAGSIDGAAASSTFRTPTGITTDGVSLYLTDTQNHTVRRVF